MIAPTGMTGIENVLRELKKSNEEDQQIARSQANSDFNKKITELRGQVDLLKQEAKKIGTMALFNFVVGLVTTALGLCTGILGNLKNVVSKTTLAILDAVQTAIGKLQEVINGFAQKEKLEMDAEIKEKEALAETYSKSYQDNHTLEQEAAQRARDVLQTMREVRQEMIAGEESMIRS